MLPSFVMSKSEGNNSIKMSVTAQQIENQLIFSIYLSIASIGTRWILRKVTRVVHFNLTRNIQIVFKFSWSFLDWKIDNFSALSRVSMRINISTPSAYKVNILGATMILELSLLVPSAYEKHIVHFLFKPILSLYASLMEMKDATRIRSYSPVDCQWRHRRARQNLSGKRVQLLVAVMRSCYLCLAESQSNKLIVSRLFEWNLGSLGQDW